jgi:hypothetical protein
VESSAASSSAFDARLLAVAAVASLAVAAIHVAAAVTDAAEGTATVLFFAGVAAAQLAWGLVSLVRGPRAWLVLGGAGNLAVAAVWVWSRTAGLPVGVTAGVALPVTFPDTVATAMEIGIAAGCTALALRGRPVDRAARRAPLVALAALAMIGALAVVAVLAELGVIAALAPAS